VSHMKWPSIKVIQLCFPDAIHSCLCNDVNWETYICIYVIYIYIYVSMYHYCHTWKHLHTIHYFIFTIILNVDINVSSKIFAYWDFEAQEYQITVKTHKQVRFWAKFEPWQSDFTVFSNITVICNLK
jgi:hypothetical protein